MNRIYQLFIATDQLANVLVSLFIGDGWADETISARAYRSKHNKHWHKAYKSINFVFFWQADHCEESYESEKLQKHLPPRYRV